MLCDLWFIPTISLYLKTILAPIISSKKRDPEEAVKYLEPLEPHHRRIFITKGLAFLFPRKITKMLLPKGYFGTPVLNDDTIKKGSFLSDIEESDDESNRTKVPPNLAPANSVIKRESSPLRLMPSSSVEGGATTPLPKFKSLPASGEPDLQLGRAISTEPNQANEQSQPIENFNSQTVAIRSSHHGHSPHKKSKIIMSSKLLRMMNNMPGRIDPSWDNINEWRVESVECVE